MKTKLTDVIHPSASSFIHSSYIAHLLPQSPQLDQLLPACWNPLQQHSSRPVLTQCLAVADGSWTPQAQSPSPLYQTALVFTQTLETLTHFVSLLGEHIRRPRWLPARHKSLLTDLSGSERFIIISCSFPRARSWYAMPFTERVYTFYVQAQMSFTKRLC